MSKEKITVNEQQHGNDGTPTKEEEIAALFAEGKAQYDKGYYDKAEKAWAKAAALGDGNSADALKALAERKLADFETEDGILIKYRGTLDSDVVIPDGITAIGYRAFYNHAEISSITIPASVKYLDDYAFGSCGINKIYYNGTLSDWCKIEGIRRSCIASNSITPYDLSSIDGVRRDFSFALYIDGKAIEGEVVIPNDVKIIDNNTFFGRNITGITIPKGVKKIEKFAFEYCTGLSSITVAEENKKYHSAYNCLIETKTKTLIAGCKNSIIPVDGSVTTIGAGAFSGRVGLTSMAIPISVTTIEAGAFSECTNLTSITLPDKLKNISNELFRRCTGLVSVTIPDGVKSIDGYAFAECSELTNIEITDTVTSIGYYAFNECKNLTNVTLPKGMTAIEEGTFYGCKSLTDITVPKSVTSIGKSAFRGCGSLTSITLPKSLTSVSDKAFTGCGKLAEIKYTGTKAEWEAFVKTHGFLNEYAVICSDGEIN